jgi:hypothetical protein
MKSKIKEIYMAPKCSGAGIAPTSGLTLVLSHRFWK